MVDSWARVVGPEGVRHGQVVSRWTWELERFVVGEKEWRKTGGMMWSERSGLKISRVAETTKSLVAIWNVSNRHRFKCKTRWILARNRRQVYLSLSFDFVVGLERCLFGHNIKAFSIGKRFINTVAVLRYSRKSV